MMIVYQLISRRRVKRGKHLWEDLSLSEGPQIIITMEIEEGSRTSSQNNHPPNRWALLKGLLCPCLLPRKPSPLKNVIIFDRSSIQSRMDKDSALRGDELDLSGGTAFRKQNTRQRKKSEEEHSRRQALLARAQCGVPERSMRETMQIELRYNNRIRSMEQINWPVCNFSENEVITVGDLQGQLLAKVSPVTIAADPDKFKKQMTKAGARKEKAKAALKFDNYEFDRFWNERYLFFERFDEGVKIKEDSWSRMPYESVSEYLAAKCRGARVIIDGYAGVGSLAIKLAAINSCAKVIANEKDKQKLAFLLNNAAIYEVDGFLELTNQDFMTMEAKKADVVVLCPPMDEIQNGVRAIDQMVGKAMSLAPNIILLLPHDSNVEALVSSISKWARKLSWMKEFCSISIEKIYNKQQLKHVLVCGGRLVQREVKLSDELDYIYARLKKYGDVYFKHKKIIKRIREDYGMLQLLSLVKQSQRLRKEAFVKAPASGEELLTIDFFYELILKKKLITPQKLAKIIQEQQESLERAQSILYSGAIQEPSLQSPSPIMEEEKLEENPLTLREPEMTTSQYSYLSYLESIGKKSRDPSVKSSADKALCSGSGVIIKRSAQQSSQLGGNSLEATSEAGEKEGASNIVSVSTRSRNSDVQESRRDEAPQTSYRKQTTFGK